MQREPYSLKNESYVRVYSLKNESYVEAGRYTLNKTKSI